MVKARVTNYKSIDDSGWVDIAEITCLVGKNESGKTAFLHALNKFNPVEGQDGDFDPTTEFPRKRLNRYKREHDRNPAPVVSVVFELDDDDVDNLPLTLDGALTSRQVTITKDYANHTKWSWPVNQQKVIENLLADAQLPAQTAKTMTDCTTVSELRARLEAVGAEPPQAAELVARIDEWKADPFQLFYRAIHGRVPRFFYFDDYSIMAGRISVPHLKAKRESGDLDEADRTFLALLRFVGAELEEFESEANYERLKADLEAASNEISDELFRFWSQNDQLAVEFDISGPDEHALPPLSTGTNLHVRIRNDRHRVTVPFDQRSRGFVWFFSFLAYFSSLEREQADRHAPLVLLLDEPGLNLHAKAQEDFLRFIDERLAGDYQVLYTTHSPFMGDPRKLDRVRTVEDLDGEGTKVSDQVFRSGSDTVFPLQAALGYELAQTLFVAPDNLLVEGPADMIYLALLDEAVRRGGKNGLDERWVIVPVGGIDKIATFVTLLGGNQLNTSVLIDASSRGQQRVDELRRHGHLRENSLIQISEIVGSSEADIEDLFDAGFYLQLVNGAEADKLPKKLTLKDLPQDSRLTRRVERYFADNGLGRPSHYRPAAYFQRNQATLLPKLSAATLERAADLFSRINKTLQGVQVPEPGKIEARRIGATASRVSGAGAKN
jgi:energy-coupling factor transporter ATP-binding protein EcfA2